MFSKIIMWLFLGGIMFCASSLFAATPTKAPQKKPIEILRNFSATGDTSELNQCLSYINENFDASSSPAMIKELLRAMKLSEEKYASYVPGFYSIMKKYYDSINNKSKSFEYALKIYKFISKVHHDKDLLWILVDIGNIFYNEKDYEQAIIFYKRAESIAVRGTDKYPLSVIYMNYGLVEADRGNHIQALKYYKISCKYRALSDNIKMISNTYIKIANTYLTLKKPDSCMYYIHLAEDYYYNKGEPTAILVDMPDYIYFTYAEYHFYFKDYKKAHFYIQKAQQYCREKGILEELLVDLNTESRYYFAEKKYNEAIRCILDILPFLKKNRMLEEQKKIYRTLGQLYSATGDYYKADEAMKNYIQLDDSLDYTVLRSQLNMIRSISAVYESDATLQLAQKNLHLAKLTNKLSVKERNTSIIITVIAVVVIAILLILFFELRTNRKRLVNIHHQLISQNQEISANSAELEATNQLKDKLFSIIAHDLRNPLNRMLVELAIVRKSIAEKDLTSQMERTLKETIELFEGLLQWSKLDNKQNIYSPTKINLNDNINKVLALYAPEINSRGIKVTKHTESLFVFADQNIIQTLLRNVVSNGILFATKNESNRTFGVEISEVEGNQVKMVIANSGPRFSDETIAEFYNQDEHIISNRTSLGMSICKLLAKMCNWKIEIGNFTNQEGVYLAIQIPRFISRQPSVEKIVGSTYNLPQQWVAKLQKLKEYKFYQTSQIRAYLRSLGEISDDAAKTWIGNLEDAVHDGNELTYEKLIQILDSNQSLPMDVN